MGNTGAYSGVSNELPLHTVTLSMRFYMSITEITQAQYRTVMGTNPSYFSGDNLPVETVNWYEAVAFCNALSMRDGFTQCYTINGTNVTCNWTADGWRLPTEAEWEYTCKGGTSTDYYNGSLTNADCTPIDANLNSIGWYCGNENNTTHQVKLKQANAFGLYDMSGNVSEWCWDLYEAYSNTAVTDPTGASSGISRVIRGGSWGDFAKFCRSALRCYRDPDTRIDGFGFRIVRIY
jgi:formylglycine-generating enzyme